MIFLLLLAFADLKDVQDIQGRTLLHMAILQRTTKFENLVTLDNINLQDNFGFTPLHLAVECEVSPMEYYDTSYSVEAIKKLISFVNLDLTSQSHFETPLHTALRCRREPELVIVLKSMQNVDMTDTFGRTPIHWAIYESYNLNVITLLTSTNNLNHQDGTGQTPLHVALLRGHHEKVISTLITLQNVKVRNYYAFNIAKKSKVPYSRQLLNNLINPKLAMVVYAAPELLDDLERNNLTTKDLFEYALQKDNLLLAVNSGRALKEQRSELITKYSASGSTLFFSILDGLLEQKTCPICLGELGKPENLFLTGCAHLFHYGCLKNWLRHEITCPICREPIN